MNAPVVSFAERIQKGTPLTHQELDGNWELAAAQLNLRATIADLQSLAAVVAANQVQTTADIAASAASDAVLLQTAIAGVTAALSSVNVALGYRIDAEFNDRSVKDAELTQSLAFEVQNRATAISAEVTARSTAIASAVSALKGGAPVDGDTLGKLRGLISGIQDILFSDDTDLMSLMQFSLRIKDLETATAGLASSKVNITDIVDALDSTSATSVLSAKQGTALRQLVLTEEQARITAVSDEANARTLGIAQEASARSTEIAGEASARASAIAQETLLREQADTAEASARLASDTAEAAARVAADQLEATNRDVAIAAEASARNVAIAAAITALKGGVSSDGDSLAKLRSLIQSLQTLVASDDINLDTVQEMIDRIKSDEGLITSLTTSKVNVADIVDSLTSSANTLPLSAHQGKVLKDFLDAETLTRTTADTAEATARASAITQEVSDRNAAIAVQTTSLTGLIDGEAATRSAADNLEITNRNAAIAAEVVARDSAISTAVSALKGGVASDGDTLNKLRLLITGTNSGTNTGDETAATIKSKLGITTLSGSNTGDQTLASLGIPNVENKSSATIRSELTSSNVSTALGYTPVSPSAVGVPGGIAGLDASGWVPLANTNPALQGAMNYKGTWNASTNSPALASGVGTKGWLYKTNVAGTTTIDGFNDWRLGDFIAFNGTIWEPWDGAASEVRTVNGQVGDAVITKASVGLANADNVSDANKPVSIAQAAADAAVQSAAASDATTKANAAQAAAIAAISSNNAGSATKLLNARSITMTGDLNWSIASFDGSGNVTASGALAPTAVTPGTYGSSSNIPVITVDQKGRVIGVTLQPVSIPSGAVTIDGDMNGTGTTGSTINVTLKNVVTAGSAAKISYNAKGLVTGGVALVAADIPNLDFSKITTGKPTTFAGYGIVDSTTNLPEGTNLYFTAARVLSTVMSGISFVTSTAVLATDTLLAAIGKLQAQITALSSSKADLLLVKSRKTANYQLAVADIGKNVYFEGAGGYTLTVPKLTTVAIPQDAAITVINHASASITVAFESGVSYYRNGSPSVQTANATLTAKSIMTLLKTEDDVWYISSVGLL